MMKIFSPIIRVGQSHFSITRVDQNIDATSGFVDSNVTTISAIHFEPALNDEQRLLHFRNLTFPNASMNDQQGQLSDRLLQMESSPDRASSVETAYLYSQLEIIQAELHRSDVDLALLLANRSDSLKLGSSSQRIGGADESICPNPAEAEIHQSDIDLTLNLGNRVRTMKLIKRCRSAIAPYSKLPHELIREIILQLITKIRPYTYFQNEMGDLRGQITQICASWRNIAFSLPELWHVILTTAGPSISIVNAWFRQCSCPKISLTTSQMLARIRSLDRSLGMLQIFTAVLSFDPLPFFDSLFSVIVGPYSHRFASLGPLMISPLQRKTIFTLPFDSLVKLSLDFRHLKGNNEPTGRISAPCLRDIYIENILALSVLPQLPWEQLKSIWFSGVLVTNDMIKLLSQCTMLKICSLHGIRQVARSPQYDDGSVVLSHLTALNITFHSQTSLSWLSTFTTSKIHSLTLSALSCTSQSLRAFIKLYHEYFRYPSPLQSAGRRDLRAPDFARIFCGTDTTINAIYHAFGPIKGLLHFP